MTQLRTKNRFNEDGFLKLEIPDGDGLILPNVESFCDLLGEPTNRESVVNSYLRSMDPSQTDGFFVDGGGGKFEVIFGNMFSSSIYRGLNKDEQPFVSSNNKYSVTNGGELTDYCIAWVLKEEFLQIFNSTSYTPRCEDFQVLNHKFKFDLEAVALHYEFISDYVEVTQDLLVALLSAYTDVDKNNRYYPISNFDGYSPTLYVGKISDTCSRLKGFQMLPRPCFRKAMAIDVTDGEWLKHVFTRVELPKNPEIAKDIFNKLNGGYALRPYCDLMDDAATNLKRGMTLNIEFLRKFCELKEYDLTAMVEKLKNKGYNIVPRPWNFFPGSHHNIHREIDNTIQYLRERVGILKITEPS